MRLWRAVIGFLSDISAARANLRDVEEILREVLSTSRGDGDFDVVLCAVLEKREPGSSFYRAPRFKSFLSESHKAVKHGYPNDPDPGCWFVIAGRVLENLPRIYGLPGEQPPSRPVC